MLYGFRNAAKIYITAAKNIEDFETYKNVEHEFPDGVSGNIANIMAMLTSPDLKGLKAAPYVIECVDEATADAVIKSEGISISRRVVAIDEQTAMIERARHASELATPDRRTLAEIHGLEDDDPWSKRSDEMREKDKEENERMKKIRDAGGLTSESFGGEVKEGVSVHNTKVTLDENNNIKSVDVLATKTMLETYELTVPSAEYLDKVFDTLRIPENRVLEQEDERATVKLHSFQIAQIGRVLKGVEYTIALIDQNGNVMPDLVSGHNDLFLFFRLDVEDGDTATILKTLAQQNVDTTTVLKTHDIDGVAVFMCVNEQPALDIAAALSAVGYNTSVYAANRRGERLLEEGAAGKIVDTNKEEEIGPRPWNDRANEIDQMTDEEKEELFKSIKASEFIYIVRKHPKHRTLIYVTPESYFREHNAIWDGDLSLVEKFTPANFLTRLEGEGSIWTSRYESEVAGSNMSNFGFIESLLLQVHVNEKSSHRIAERSV